MRMVAGWKQYMDKEAGIGCYMAKKSFKNVFYPESEFGDFTDIDGTIAFFARVNSILKPSFTVLDVGCGRGSYKDDTVGVRRNLRVLKGKARQVIGIDVDEDARCNPFLDKFDLIKDNVWPVDDNSIDLIVCDNVLEHIEFPDNFFSEAGRVIRDGGYFCIRTPNLLNYIALFSKLIPKKFHSKTMKIIKDTRKELDLFPTHYRCNTVAKIKSMMKKYGFKGVVYGYEAEPSYLSFSKFAYGIGVLHQRLAPKIFKPSIFAFGQIDKKGVFT
ncbi:MAG: methyltransferase domain-containing protein [Candidatus Omnitrophota bacterium]